MSDPVEQLIRQAQAGDPEAATKLVAHFYERVFAYLRRLCPTEEDAADLTQKTFARLWTALPSYAGRSSFSTWLHGIAHHVYLDWRCEKHLSLPQSDEWWVSHAAPGPSPSEDVAERELANRLYALVDQLADEARQPVHLHYYQGLSLAETAEVLGIATSTVKYRLREAIEYLRARTAEPEHQIL